MSIKHCLMAFFIVLNPLLSASQPALDEVLKDVERYTKTLDEAAALKLKYIREAVSPAMDIGTARKYAENELQQQRFSQPNSDPASQEKIRNNLIKALLEQYMTEQRQQFIMEYLLDGGIIQKWLYMEDGSLLQTIRQEGLTWENEDRVSVVLRGMGKVQHSTRTIAENMRWRLTDLMHWREGISLIPKEGATVELLENRDVQLTFDAVTAYESKESKLTLILRRHEEMLLPVQYKRSNLKGTTEYLYADFAEVDGVLVPSKFQNIMRETELLSDPPPLLIRPMMLLYTLIEE